jgi:hypothetical protein
MAFLLGRSEVFTMVNIKSSVYWDVVPYNFIDRYQCFRKTSCLHAKCRRMKMEAVVSLEPIYLTASLPKRQLNHAHFNWTQTALTK